MYTFLTFPHLFLNMNRYRWSETEDQCALGFAPPLVTLLSYLPFVLLSPLFPLAPSLFCFLCVAFRFSDPFCLATKGGMHSREREKSVFAVNKSKSKRSRKKHRTSLSRAIKLHGRKKSMRRVQEG